MAAFWVFTWPWLCAHVEKQGDRERARWCCFFLQGHCSFGIRVLPLQLMKYLFSLSCSVMCDSLIPWTVVYQTPPSLEFSRKKYWSGLPFPSPVDLPDLGIEPSSVQLSSFQLLSRVQLSATPWIKLRSPALQADTLSSEPPGKPYFH